MKNKVLVTLTALMLVLNISNTYATVAWTWAIPTSAPAPTKTVVSTGATATTTGSVVVTGSIFTNVKVVTTTDKTVELTWDKVAWATSYMVKYDIVSRKGTTTDYATPIEKIVKDDAKIVVENLNPNTQYFFVIDAVSTDFQTIGRSDEIEAKTIAMMDTFAVKNITTPANNVVLVEFNKDLNVSAVAQSAIEVTNVATNVKLNIVSKEISGTNAVKLTVDTPMTESTWYKIVVVSVESIDGKNVNQWVDSIKEFATPATFEQAAAPVEAATATWATAPEAEKLPQTGPKEMVLLLLSILLAVWVVAMNRKKA